MARIRTIKPDFWESEKVGSLSPIARLNFIGLISLADDEGRGRGDIGFLAGRLHPYDHGVTVEVVSDSLREIEDAGLVQIYSDNSGCAYYHLPGFLDNQRIDKPKCSKLPPPPEVKESKSSNTSQGRVQYESKTDQGQQDKKEAAKQSAVESSHDANILAAQLKERILANDPKAHVPDNLSGWVSEADKILRLDHRDLPEVKWLIDWATKDDFWRSNILSMGKFRKKYTTLLLQSQRKGVGNGNYRTVGAAKGTAGKYSDIKD